MRERPAGLTDGGSRASGRNARCGRLGAVEPISPSLSDARQSGKRTMMPVIPVDGRSPTAPPAALRGGGPQRLPEGGLQQGDGGHVRPRRPGEQVVDGLSIDPGQGGQAAPAQLARGEFSGEFGGDRLDDNGGRVSGQVRVGPGLRVVGQVPGRAPTAPPTTWSGCCTPPPGSPCGAATEVCQMIRRCGCGTRRSTCSS